jgi:hypothetical protein
MNKGWTLALALGAVASSAAPAVAVTIGASLPSSGAGDDGVADTYKVSQLRVADRDGGPPWGLATFRAKPIVVQRRSVDRGCIEVGRVVDGRLGAITAADVFRPYEPMQGLFTFCGALLPGSPGFVIGNALQLQPTRLTDPCLPPPAPSDFPGPVCGPDAERTIVAAGLGRGILGASLSPAAPGRSVATTHDGLLLAIMPGGFTEAAEPVLRVRATLCGPDRRPDLRRLYSSRTRGCGISFTIPDVRPVPESAASRRARRARSLHQPMRVIEHKGTASIRRFTARVTIPITVRSATEGYAYRLTGPGGRACLRTQTADTTGDKLSSFLMIQGKPYDLPILPFNTNRGGWCKGTYRLAIYFVVRTDRTTLKRIAANTFRVKR